MKKAICLMSKYKYIPKFEAAIVLNNKFCNFLKVLLFSLQVFPADILNDK